MDLAHSLTPHSLERLDMGHLTSSHNFISTLSLYSTILHRRGGELGGHSRRHKAELSTWTGSGSHQEGTLSFRIENSFHQHTAWR